MNLNVVPEGLTATSAAVEALTARLAAAHAAAAPVIGAVVAPGGRSGVAGDRGGL
ncbi:PE family protein [Mycobacteroides abscessus 4S-0726-RB]|nr:PE family protein [Mycobacteroides abscessus 4S-0726-RB]